MSSKPSWLPDVVRVDGEWEQIVTMLYGIFTTDIKNGGLTFHSHEIWWDRKVEPGDEYEAAFWHLISRKDLESGDRLLDPRRAERLPWFAPTIKNKHTSDVSVFNFTEGDRTIRTYVWLKDYDYVIILQKKQIGSYHVYLIITAFHVDGNSQRRRLQRKLERQVL